MTLKRFACRMRLPTMVIVIVALSSPASAGWKEKVLYSFQGAPDGSLPGGGVVFDQAGNLYGVTAEGGSGSCPPAQCGIVYQLSPPARKGGAWTETVLYVFNGHQYGDGSSPAGTLLVDSSGNLYGGTAYGGTGDCMLLGGAVGCGTVYELSPPKEKGGAWAEKVLYSFKGGKDRQLAGQTLTFDGHGNLYGATTYGGGYGTCNAPYYRHCGTIYELSPPKTTGGEWTEKVLYSFKAGKDGANPNGGLLFDIKGTIYGTTFGGGNESGECGVGGCGTVFDLRPPTKKSGAWAETVLHRFNRNTSDGGIPSAGFVIDGKGYLYGTTITTVFRFAPPSKKSGRWEEEILYTFNPQKAYGPEGALILDQSGDLYGTTYSSNTFHGTVFRLKSPSRTGGNWTFAILYGLTGPPDGGQPAGNLVFDKNGNLYSTTTQGGSGTGCSFHGCGTVFEVSP
jgi:hypothetical protein